MDVLIIEDESKARNLIRNILVKNCSFVANIYEAKNLLDGVDMIREQAPHLVFLDIEMPEHSGLEIFNFIKHQMGLFVVQISTNVCMMPIGPSFIS